MVADSYVDERDLSLDPEEITRTLKHKYGCQCFLCIATYGNPLEDGDDDGLCG